MQWIGEEKQAKKKLATRKLSTLNKLYLPKNFIELAAGFEPAKTFRYTLEPDASLSGALDFSFF